MVGITHDARSSLGEGVLGLGLRHRCVGCWRTFGVEGDALGDRGIRRSPWLGCGERPPAFSKLTAYLLEIFRNRCEMLMRILEQLFLLGQGPHQIVLDKSRCSLGIVHPAAQRDHKLVGLDGARAVEVDHVEELLQIHFVNVHDSKPALQNRVSPGSGNQLLQRKLSTAVLVDPLKELLQLFLVHLQVMFHLLGQIFHIFEPGLSKRVHNHRNDNIQNTEDQSQQGANEDQRSPGAVFDYWHCHLTPAISSNYRLEEKEVC
mmetsp:Transcript_19393/g.40108  ORF Transcript_19393/g.40108 Transcript_19393/m.40108 type:complete len:261 (+) Transcript_19393:337-1119(+)